MPSPVKKRKNYSLDITTLNRIQSAVRDDDRIPKDSREAIVTNLHKAMRGLMAFDASTIGQDDDVAEGAEGQDGEEEEESGPSAA